MGFSFPAPKNGWRQFSGEVGIIVLGVLIALGAGQLLDAWQWRQQVKQANEAFSTEMVPAALQAYVRLAVVNCNEERLREIAARLNEPGMDWRGMPERTRASDTTAVSNPQTSSGPYNASTLVWSSLVTESWSNALANGTINHLPQRQSASISRAYAFVREFIDYGREEAKAEAQLSPLGTDRPLSPESRLAMLQTVKELERLNREIAESGDSILFYLKQAAMLTDDEIEQEQMAGAVMTLERNRRGSCVTKPKMPPGADELNK